MIEENEKITKKEGYLKMNKKSLLMMMVTICLIAVVGVGATLAYLTDTTGELTNTFTFVDDGIDITLDEELYVNGVDQEKRTNLEDKDKTNDGSSYANIIPGQVLNKDPRVTVKNNSVDCYVFVSVKNPNTQLTIAGLDSNNGVKNYEDKWANSECWELVGENAENKTKCYVYCGNKAKDKVVSTATSTGDVVLENVFDCVVCDTELDEEEGVFSDIIIKAAAIQATYNDYETARNDALKIFKCTLVE